MRDYLLIVLFLLTTGLLHSQDAREIVRKADEKARENKNQVLHGGGDCSARGPIRKRFFGDLLMRTRSRPVRSARIGGMQAATSPATALDHLVVMADSLAQGVAWCEATLGLTPAPGGAHALFGTHNRLLAIGSPAWPQAYLEIIAIDPAVAPRPVRRRWFDMDDAALQAAVRAHGPRDRKSTRLNSSH